MWNEERKRGIELSPGEQVTEREVSDLLVSLNATVCRWVHEERSARGSSAPTALLGSLRAWENCTLMSSQGI